MAQPAGVDRPLQKEPDWPTANGGRTAFLIDASSGLERRILEGWIERQRPPDQSPDSVDVLHVLSTRRRRRTPSRDRLDSLLAADSDVVLAPLRVAWLPKKRGGRRMVRFSDVLMFGDPRDPDRLREHWILRRGHDCCRVVAGDSAPASELRARWRLACGSDLAQTTGLAEFVARQAGLALERAERRLRGARYKVPRLVREDILRHPAFRGVLADFARQSGRSEASIGREAARNLKEIAATHSPFVIDLVAHLIRLLYTQGYDAELRYDAEQLRDIEALAQRHPVVFLPSHKSNLDHLVLQYALHENGHAPNHTAGGINMNFFPVGPLVRRSGVFFIRRGFKDERLYKLVLGQYIDYLVEKRFSLEWYIEGGRSRSGKLLPPRFGMLAYVVDAYRRNKSEDVVLIPTSLAYDQISDVNSYAAEQSGAVKRPESFSWFVGIIRSMRRSYGHIHIHFGEPIFLSKIVARRDPSTPPDPDERSLETQKLAFEVAVRINRVTPITPTSLVTMALLGGGEQAKSSDEIETELENLLLFIRRRDLPITGDFDLYDPASVKGALPHLVENGVVTEYSDGPEAVYRITGDRQLNAAYYRNTMIHFFVNSAIAELALLSAAEEREKPTVDAFWTMAMELRDLMKFEFFFSEKEAFRSELQHELSIQDGSWDAHLRGGPESTMLLLRTFRPFCAHRVLRPFLEAYRLVGDTLEHERSGSPIDEPQLVDACVGLGRQYLLQQRIRSAASVSQVLIRTALKLAGNRGLLDAKSPQLDAGRAAFAEQIRATIRRIDAIEALATSRRVGLID